jgi:PAS domain S-box-containing protein
MMASRRAARVQDVVIAIAGSYAALGGLLALLGWMLDIPRLIDWRGSGITMKANTAVCALAAGLGLLLARFAPQRQWCVRSAGVFLAVLGGLTLLEHLGNWNLGIDTLLFDEPPGAVATAAPGRMGPPAASSFMLIGVALLLVTGNARARRWAAALGITVGCIAALPLVGFLFGASQLYTIPRLTGIALQTASMLAALGVGLAVLVAEHGLAAALRADDAGGITLRQLVVPVVLLPVLIAWVRLSGEEAGLYDTAFGTAARTLIEIVLLLGFLWWTATGLSRAQQELQASQRWLQTVLMSIGDAVIATDRQGRVNFLNPVTVQLTGWSAPEASGKSLGQVFRIIDEQSRQPLESPVDQVMRDAPAVVGQANHTLLIAKDGRETPIAYSVAPMREASGEITGLVLVFRDQTPERRAADVLRRSQAELATANEQLASRAKQLDKLVERRTAELRETVGELEVFSYAIAHDLREPLRAIQGYANILKEDHTTQLDATGQKYVTRLGAASERMYGLVTDILTYSRLTRQELPSGPVALLPLVEDIIEQYPHLKEAHIRIADPLPSVLGHSGALTQVISNLLTNAVKFVAPGKQPQVAVSVSLDEQWATLSIRDNGIGIAPEHQERIFRMFERVHSTEKYQGTGIGLAIVHRAVARMGGSTGVESTVGQGSRFWIRLRRAETTTG